MSAMCEMTRAAASMAFTALGVCDECAARPFTQQRQRCTPLCAMAGTIIVGSPTRHSAGATPASRRSAIMFMAPKPPTSSS